MTAIQTKPACPSWCSPEQHGRNELDTGDYIHMRYIDEMPDVEVWVSQVALSESVPQTDAPFIYLANDRHDGELTAAQARHFAAMLVTAANELDRINAEMSA